MDVLHRWRSCQHPRPVAQTTKLNSQSGSLAEPGAHLNDEDKWITQECVLETRLLQAQAQYTFLCTASRFQRNTSHAYPMDAAWVGAPRPITCRDFPANPSDP